MPPSSTYTIQVANDDTLYSNPDGGGKYHWSDPSTWQMCNGADWIQVYVHLLEIKSGSNLRIQIVGRWSHDGKNWVDFNEQLQTGTSLSAVGRTRKEYAGDLCGFEFAEYVKFGIYVFDTSSTDEEWARLTCSVKVHGASASNASPATRLPTFARAKLR